MKYLLFFGGIAAGIAYFGWALFSRDRIALRNSFVAIRNLALGIIGLALVVAALMAFR